MHEQKNKDIKSADKNNLKAISKEIAKGEYDDTKQFILDSITQFVHVKPTVSFKENGEELIADAQVYGEKVRNCKP